MARYIGPKNKLSRREGFDLFDKGTKLRRAEVKPGMHGYKPRKSSEHGKQLRAKQRIKRMYGLLETQFRNYVKKSQHTKGDVQENMAGWLESRLDNVVFRLGWAKTRPQARQMVTHGHITVNNRKLNVPSARVKVNDKIGVIKKFRPENLDGPLPHWLEVKDLEGVVVKEPGLADISEALSLTEVIEFYSR